MKQENGMASLKDISKICGVSVATVSKALNDHKDIGEETKANIRRVAKEMGYSPNLSARALKTNRTYGIGVLFVDEAQSGLTHDYFSSVLDSFKRTAEKSGYDITFNNRIAIMSDNVTGMKELLEYIYSRGHRKIAYIHGAMSAVTSGRLSSFYRTAERLGLQIPDEYIREAAYRDTATTYRMTNELLDLPDPPTCIIYPDDFASFGGINAIRERGLRIPEDISVAGYDGIQFARQLEPKLTTVQQDTEQIGCLAARELISLIERPKTTIIEQVIVPGKVVEGKSVAQIPTDK